MKKLSYIVIISILFASINCSNKKNPVESKLGNKEMAIDSDSIDFETVTQKVEVGTKSLLKKKKLVINSIIPYRNPVSIEELYSKIYVVDTLYNNIVPNEIGRDDDEHELIFNKIIGIDTNKVKFWGRVFAMPRTKYFNPISKINDDYYLPFCVEGECDWTVILKWKKTDAGFNLQKHFKNRFATKYAKLKVSNVLMAGENRYLSIEIFRPDESGTIRRQIYVAKETTETSLEILDHFYINDNISDDFVDGCSMEFLNNNIKVTSKIKGLNFDSSVVNIMGNLICNLVI